MTGRTAYLDTSAFVKLVVEEPESAALRAFLARRSERASATLLRTEAVRALRRSGNDHLVGPARRLMTTITLIRVDEPLLDQAADLRPPHLRSLNAIHLAAALTIGPDLDTLVTYDTRLAESAEMQGLDVSRPA